MSYGGGYLNSPDKNHDNTDRSASKTGEKDEKKANIIPLTIKMLKDATNESKDDIVLIDDQKADHILIYGRLINIDEKGGKTTLSIDDCTGSLETVIYKKSEAEIPKILANINLKENMYLKAVVLLRSFKGSSMCVCQYLQEVEDFNEITLHFAKILQAYLIRTKGYLKDDKALDSGTKVSLARGPQVGGTNVLKSQELMNNINRIVANPAIQVNQKVFDVMKLIAEKNGEIKIPLGQIEDIFKNKINSADLKKILKQLQGNGVIYEASSNFFTVVL